MRSWLLVLALTIAPAAPAQPKSQRVVAVVPLGEVEPAYVQAVARAVEARVDAQVRVEPTRPLPPEAYHAPRRRYRAEKLLDALDAQPPAGAWKVLALTQAEISTTKDDIPDWGIGGLGNIGGRSCVVSAFLVRKHSRGQKQLVRRLADLAVHELGHTLGMPHCPTKGCVMRDANGKLLRSLDSSNGHYCEVCRLRAGPVLRPAP